MTRPTSYLILAALSFAACSSQKAAPQVTAAVPSPAAREDEGAAVMPAKRSPPAPAPKGSSTGLAFKVEHLRLNDRVTHRIELSGDNNTVFLTTGTGAGPTSSGVVNGVGTGRATIPAAGPFSLSVRGNGNVIHIPASARERVEMDVVGAGNQFVWN